MTTLTIDQAFQQAINYHRAGSLPEAEKFYRAILQAAPNHPAANHNLGVLMVSIKTPELALPFLKKALEMEKMQAAFWLDYIDALIQVNQLDLASTVLAQGRDEGLDGEQTDIITERLATVIRNAANLSLKNKNIKPKNGKQPSSKALKKLANLFHQNNLNEAEIYARELIEQFPAGGYAWKILSIILAQSNRLHEAIPILRKAVILLPNDPDTHCNLGNALCQQNTQSFETENNFEEALECFENSLLLHPTRLHVIVIKAGVLIKLGRYEEAEKILLDGLKVEPLCVDAHLVLASAFQSRNLLHEANASYLKALEIKPDTENAALGLAINYYLLLDFASVNEFFERALPILNRPKLKEFKSEKTYIAFLLELFNWWKSEIENTGLIFNEQNHRLPILAVIGESHSLSVHRTNFEISQRQHRCHAVWINGMKMWHLAQTTSHPMKQRVMEILSNLPTDMPVMFTIGEIDCRLDEGIWKTAKKKSKSYQDLAQETVMGYLNWLENALKNTGHQRIIIQGIPAPNYPLDQNASEVIAAFLGMISLVNQQLMFHSISKGWQFLDVYAATALENGRSNQQWHLDQNHLVPGFYAQAHKWLINL